VPAGWDDYTVTEEELGDETYFDFFLPTTDTSGDYPDGTVLLFTITATSGDPITMAEFLGENSVYEFYFSHLNGFPPTDLEDRVLEFDQIKSTFMAFEPMGPLDPLGSFSDTGGHPYDMAIDYMKTQGMIEGYPDGTYKPDAPINRAEFTKILLEAYTEGVIDETYTCYQTYDVGIEACAGDGECGLPVWEDFAECTFGAAANDIPQSDWDSLIEYDTCFPDVPMGEWFAKYVCLAKMLGIIGGYPDGTFKPADNVNLAEALKIIFETRASIDGVTITPVAGEWYQVYMDMAYDAMILDTIDADPGHLLTRGEMAELIFWLETSA
jgi:hypothetical protein